MMFPTAPNLGFALCPSKLLDLQFFLTPFVFFISFLNCEISCGGQIVSMTVLFHWIG
jgi:hypothetical protein